MTSQIWGDFDNQSLLHEFPALMDNRLSMMGYPPTGQLLNLEAQIAMDIGVSDHIWLTNIHQVGLEHFGLLYN